jgi:hypothetical protein
VIPLAWTFGMSKPPGHILAAVMPGDPAGVELFKPAFQTTCLIWRKRHRRWQMSSLSAQPLDAPWRCPFLGVDRKWPERPDSVAFDPKRSAPSGQRFAGCVGEGSQQPETFPWFSS